MKKFLENKSLHGLAAIASLVFLSLAIYDRYINLKLNKLEIKKLENEN